METHELEQMMIREHNPVHSHLCLQDGHDLPDFSNIFAHEDLKIFYDHLIYALLIYQMQILDHFVKYLVQEFELLAVVVIIQMLKYQERCLEYVNLIHQDLRLKKYLVKDRGLYLVFVLIKAYFCICHQFDQTDQRNLYDIWILIMYTSLNNLINKWKYIIQIAAHVREQLDSITSNQCIGALRVLLEIVDRHHAVLFFVLGCPKDL